MKPECRPAPFDVRVGLLRQKLEDDAREPRHFLTMRDHGYKFVA